MKGRSIRMALFAACSVALAAAPAPTEGRAYLGLQFVGGPACTAIAGTATDALCVQTVRPGGAADRVGLKPGDILERIGSVEVSDPASLQRAAQSLRTGQSIEVAYQRAGARHSVTVHFEPGDAEPPTAAPMTSPPVVVPQVVPQTDSCEATRAGPGPLTPPYRKQTVTAGPRELTALLGDRKAAIALESDVLTFAFRANASEARLGAGSVQCALERVGDGDLWALQLKMSEWDRTFLSVQFMAKRDGAWAQIRADFRGNAAPPALPDGRPGKLIVDEVPSATLGLSKTVTVYLPARRPARPLPVIYVTDGQGIAPFASILDDLISKGRIPPVALVGVHSPAYHGDPTQPIDFTHDDRAREYLPIADPAYHARYLKFFVDELMPWAERKYRLSARRVDRAVLGWSNGGAFVESLGLRRPEAVGAVLAFSPAMPYAAVPTSIPDASVLPRFRFSGGELEPPFLNIARGDAAALQKIGADAQVRAYWSGHDTLQWEQAMADYLPEMFTSRVR